MIEETPMVGKEPSLPLRPMLRTIQPPDNGRYVSPIQDWGIAPKPKYAYWQRRVAGRREARAERKCARAEGVGLAEGEARAAKRPRGPAPAYVPVSG